jgi:hypothetical protein
MPRERTGFIVAQVWVTITYTDKDKQQHNISKLAKAEATSHRKRRRRLASNPNLRMRWVARRAGAALVGFADRLPASDRFFDGMFLVQGVKGIREDNVIRLPFADGKTALLAGADEGAAAAAVRRACGRLRMLSCNWTAQRCNAKNYASAGMIVCIRLEGSLLMGFSNSWRRRHSLNATRLRNWSDMKDNCREEERHNARC